MWATGAGSDVMKRIAAPMVGGIFTSFLLELLVYPAIYSVWRGRSYAVSAKEARRLESLQLQPEAGPGGSGWMWKASIPPQESPGSR